MKINCIGTGTMGSTTRGNQSILIDDILFDIGSGVVKKLEEYKFKTKDINYLLITHAHADHFVDLPNLLIGRSIRNENNNLLHIICGKGIREKVVQLFQLCFGDGVEDKYIDIEEKFNIKFIELSNEETFEDQNIKITAYELMHGGCKPILGYILEKEGKNIGYATDTILCDNVNKICQKSDIAFLDANNINATKSHMSLDDVVKMQKENHKCKVCAIHRGDYSHEKYLNIKFPEDGEIIEL